MSKTATKDKPVSQREKEVIDRYTNPKGSTYLNGTQSIIASPGYKTTTNGSARAMATEVLARPHVADAVKDRLEALGIGEAVREEKVAKIAKGFTEEIVTTTVRDKD